MMNFGKRMIALALALAMLAPWFGVRASAAENYRRISGENRFETAFQVAEELRERQADGKFDAVVIASGTNFADALSGSYLANIKGAPILLSYNDTYNEKAKDYIRANLAENGTVYILGGTAAVPESMETGLEGYTLKRLAGANRFETNLLILQEAGVTAGQEVLVCTGTNFADSLSASAVGLPILLVWNESGALTDSQKAYLATLSGNEFCVIGGESAVGAELEEAVGTYGSVERLAGGDRFETSVLVAERYFAEPETAVLAYAWNYPDGLCGGPLAYAMGCPLILTMGCYEQQAYAYTEKYNINEGIVLGGEKLISVRSAEIIFYRTAEPGHLFWERIVSPTCKQKGYLVNDCIICGYSCKAGDLEDLGPASHVYVNTKTVEPTCTEDGYTAYACKWCGKTYKETLEATGHHYTVMNVPGGMGESMRDCRNCDLMIPVSQDAGIVCVYTRISGTSTKHDWSEWTTVTEPTETSTGMLERSCVNCDLTETKVLDKLEPGHTHSWLILEISYTCTTRGYTRYYCTGCGICYLDKEIRRSEVGHGHLVETWKVTEEPSATNIGTREGVCTICGETVVDNGYYSLEYTPSYCENHEWDEFPTPGTCIKEEHIEYFCHECRHGFDVITGEKDPDNHYLKLLASVNGYDVYWCWRCGYEEIRFAENDG